MSKRPGSGWARLLALGALVLLTACDQRGFNSLQAEWDRRRSGPYHIVTADHDRAVVSALGRQVAIEPSEGFCLAEESLETTPRSAFAMIGDCVLEEGGDQGRRGEKGELFLPRGVPGIITVSISGDPGFDGFGDPLSEFSEYLDTDDGKALLGRSGDGSAVRVIENRRIGDAVYVLVEDGGDAVVPVLDSQFWRAFMQVNDRLAVVTVNGFRARPLGSEEMLKYLKNQVQTLAEVNRNPIFEEPDILVASGERRGRPLPQAGADGGEPQLISDIEPDAVIVTTEQEPVPLPPTRPSADGPGEEAPSETAVVEEELEEGEEAATANAPRTAPVAPPRPSSA